MIAELRHHEVAVSLFQVAVQAGAADPRRTERLLHAGHGRLEIAEDDGRLGRAGAQDRQQRARAGVVASVVHGVGPLARQGPGTFRVPDGQAFGVVLMRLGHRVDRPRIGRRKEDGLPRFGRAAEDLPHLGAKAHLQHAVGLVDDDGRDAAQIQRATHDVIEGPARRSDDHVHAPLQRRQLGLHRLPAREDQDGKARFTPPQLAELARHLRAQLARGAQDQRLRAAFARLQLLQDRQAEGRGLPAAGGGLSDQVPPRQQQGNGARLNGRRRGEAQLGHHLTQAGGEAERGEPAVSCGNRHRRARRHGRLITNCAGKVHAFGWHRRICVPES